MRQGVRSRHQRDSRTSPLPAQAGSRFRDWLRDVGDESFLSVVTISELQYGLALLIARGATQKAQALRAWIGSVMDEFADRLLPVDQGTALVTGDMLARAKMAGFEPGYEDACIGATAKVRGLVVLTYNAIDFEALGAPFEVPGDALKR